ncbi:MAG: entericidin EcnA/B family protein [Pseudomonadota bacterium]
MTRTLLIATVLLTLGACNTVDGIGRDISKTARTVEAAF